MKLHHFFALLLAVLVLAACGTTQQAARPDSPATFGGGSVSQVAPIYSFPSAAPGELTDETPEFWFVEFAEPALEARGSLAELARERAEFRSAAAREGVTIQVRFDFQRLWNGLSVRVDPAQLSTLARLPGVAAIYPVGTISIPEVQTDLNPELATALAMTGADVAQSELGLSGRGIRVAVMDTGIDYNHPDLGGGWGNRVVAGWDFVGDAFNAGDPANNVPIPDPSPMDPNGHGTHVAGIIGAQGAVTGVAPGVVFGAYKVFGREGSTTADIMIAAMEMALADGMDILNMSIGSAFQWPQHPTATASNNLVNRGMVVVASIGNSGPEGVYSSGSPGVGREVIGVASVDNTHIALNAFTITPDATQIGYSNAAGAPPAPTSGTLPMARTGTVASPADACSALPPTSLTGQAALIRRGGCAFRDKVLNAHAAGASAVVLYNNVTGRFSPTVVGTPAITIPVVAISDAEGVLIDSRLALGSVSMTWTDGTLAIVVPTGGLISSFSSFGLAPDLSLKPDISAPGGLIRSTWPLALGRYATASGTSMSAPHVAGAVALLLEAHPRTSPQAVRGILQSSARPGLWRGNPPLGHLDNVHLQGAGLLNIPAAVTATTRIEPARLALGESQAGKMSGLLPRGSGPRWWGVSLGESQAGQVRTMLTLENQGDSAVIYDLSAVNALSTGGTTLVPTFFTSNATVRFDAPSVTVPAEGTATVTATITPATEPALGQYGGYLVLTPRAGGDTLRVPFAGFVGDYQALVALSPRFGLPWLGRVSGGLVNLPTGGTFTLVGDDRPMFIFQLAHQVRRLRVEIFDSVTGRAWHRAFPDLHYLPRNATSGVVFTLAWDGTTVRGRQVTTLPDGSYVARLSVQKALGDDNNPAHWETWTSPVITIDRP